MLISLNGADALILFGDGLPRLISSPLRRYISLGRITDVQHPSHLPTIVKELSFYHTSRGNRGS
jgi:hypothetical protein